MFAVLGPIFFEVLTSPQTLRAGSEYKYARHEVVESAPRLQWLANNLQKISLGMHFHAVFTNPATQMLLLTAAAEAHQAMPLVFGNGVFRGYFVIESIEETHQQMADDGSFLALEARVELCEWVPGAEFDPFAPPLTATPPSGIVQAPGIGSITPRDSLAAISATNLLPSIRIEALSTVGAPAGVTYAPASYAQQGVSAILGGAGGVSITPGSFSDVLASTIVRAG
jgi:phage protein U